MVKTIKLNAISRDIKKESANQNRREGYIPAVLYGSGQKNLNLKVKDQEINKFLDHHDTSSLIDLSIDGATPIITIIKDKQHEVLKNKLIHLDFYRLNMKNKIEVEIPLHFINEPKIIKEVGGTLIKNFETLEVKCLPSDLLEKIEVDLFLLNTYEDIIKISDLHLPPSFEITKHPEDVVAHVIEPKVEVEEEVKAPEAVPAEPTAETEGQETTDKKISPEN
ncbi:MAG: 50S ribosomal protein L25 [Candidatus Falkowbacteria bacterium]|nr:50S ribosomal protein L25 [Candidatus Falkowbacteria bacterium]